jgi:glycosyltransferase involved in cell wall biosynthesis
MTMGNHTQVPNYRRCWPFQLLMWPLYYTVPQLCERPFYFFFPVWRTWLKRQTVPTCNVIHALMGFATEPFEMARSNGALKVVDCPNSHPTSYYGYMQRECDLWCPGANVPIPRWMFARMNRELEAADVVVCPSNFVQDTMVQNGVPVEKCFVNPFGVDTSIFAPRAELVQPPVFICVGMICLRKGHQYLFRAFEIVKRSVPDAQLICVGEYRSDFRRERVKWGGKFRHYEHLSHQELAPLLARSTAFVLPSVEEGFARVLTEAMAAGLPIIASYESGATTLVQDGVEGFIVPPRDPQRLAEAMVRIAIDRDLNRKMGDAAYRKGAVKNTWQDYGDRLLAEYERRLRDRDKPSATGA